ncbi:MAG: M24 family metallopeptidase, partial [Chloroflexales bacterium]
YERRCAELYAAVSADWVAVYGDREHAANMAFCCGFDPRFEEAMLLLGPTDRRVLLVGNEGVDYVPAVVSMTLEVALCQSFSLMGQPRAAAPSLLAVLRAAGVGQGAQVGLAGWKYLEPAESDDPVAPAFVPAMVLSALPGAVGPGGAISDATAALMHPAHGLRHRNSAAQIVRFADTAARASAAVLRVVQGARPGMREREAVALMGYQGDPLSCHTMLSAAGGGEPLVGLRSPGDRVLAEGDAITTALGLQGSLCCRAGLLRAAPDPDFQARYVAPYFSAIAAWWGTLRLGLSGDELHRAVFATLEGATFRPALNPGHLIGLDEWTHSPVRPGSAERIASGMLLQCDIIPSPMPLGRALNCEDTVAVADAALRAELRATAPELWAQIEARRSFMREALGISLADELLPLSLAPAYLMPFWLAPNLVCAVAR